MGDNLAEVVNLDAKDLFSANSKVSEKTKAAAKHLFDEVATKLLVLANGSSAEASAMLPELYVEGFDAEQIWQQYELQTDPLLRRVKKLLKAAGEDFSLLPGGAARGGAASDSGEEDVSDMDEEEEEEEDDVSDKGASDLSEGEEEEEMEGGSDDSGLDSLDGSEEEEEGSEGEEEEEEEEEAAPSKKGSRRGAARVDPRVAALEDGFFRLEDMEAFLGEAEEEEMGDPEARDREASALFRGEGEEEDDEEEEDEFGLGGLGGKQEDMDSDEEELERALSAAGAGRGPGSKKAARRGKGGRKGKGGRGGPDEDEEGEDGLKRADELMYEDFFGPRKVQKGKGGAAVPDKGRRRREEEEEEEGGEEEEGRPLKKKVRFDLDEEEDMEEEERQQMRRTPGRPGRRPQDESDEEGEEEEGEGEGGSDEEVGAEGEERLSTHERRLRRLASQISRLEERALGDKPWEMRGEARAGDRPINSALEVDLDFERTVRPPPKPTEETTRSLEDVIRRRIGDRRFDDVVRVVPSKPKEARPEFELNDEKSKKGLAELYEDDFLKGAAQKQAEKDGSAAGGAGGAKSSRPLHGAEDKEEPLRREARLLFKELCGKLDALSHFYFAPKPYVEELEVHAVSLPAVAMEEVMPVAAAGDASMQAPEEVFRPASKKGTLRSEAELSKEDRQRRRAQKKRGGKADRERKEAERRARAVAEGGVAPVQGRKSAEAELAAQKKAKKKGLQDGAGSGARQAGRKSDFSKSAGAFARIQEAQEVGRGGRKVGAGKEVTMGAPAKRATSLKL